MNQLTYVLIGIFIAVIASGWFALSHSGKKRRRR